MRTNAGEETTGNIADGISSPCPGRDMVFVKGLNDFQRIIYRQVVYLNILACGDV